ncbi:BTAD domain-containing putative transcriptional regulator [Mycolicibacterium brisbanense]|nr:BTAD domain-containing putative transcriptional regulator [Mycolicibacterium brisbanense]
MELEVLGPLQVRKDGAPVLIPGAKPRAILTMLGLHGGSVVPATTLIELLWGDAPPRTAVKALQTHISSLRHALGDGFVLTEGTGWRLSAAEVDASRYKRAAGLGRAAAASGDTSSAVARFGEAVALWRGVPELPDGRRGTSEKTRWAEGHAALIEDRADALLTSGRAAEIIGELEAAVADAPLRERRWGQLMLALYRAGRQGEALGAYRRARTLLADELGIDPSPELRRLEAAIVAQDDALDLPAAQHVPAVTRAVTFLLTDIEGSTAAWEADADAMAVALARHDELIEQVITSRGGRLIKTRGEGDATFSVFDRPSAAASAAIELQEAILQEPWALAEPMRIRVAVHTGEAELRDGDYFGRSVNRAARLRSLATGGQILCSGATAELVIDSLSDDVALVDLGTRQLKNLARPEHVYEIRLDTHDYAPPPSTPPIARPELPAVLTGSGPFVGRESELSHLTSAWQATLTGGTRAVLIAGEPGVGKTRLAGEWSCRAYQEGAVVLYGRCDEDLGAPYQPFAESLRVLVPCVGGSRLRGLRGVEALLPLVPGLLDVLPDLAAPTPTDPDTERYALFDAVVALLEIASAAAPIVLVLDDLHWAAKPTLLLLRHVLRFGEHARVQVVGTYRSTDLDRSHPLAAMLADLNRDGFAGRIQLSGLGADDVTEYVAEAGYDDGELARALASVTGGNPFFLIEALRHVGESGGRWDPSTLPQGVREAVSRRLSRLSAGTNQALSAAAVVGSRFAVDLVEQVVGRELVDAFDEACAAGIVIEEPGGRYRFNHAIVRQSLLAELASVRRMRLHQRIATTLENAPGVDDQRLAELAHHYFECAWAGNAFKAVEYCRRAADQAMTRLAYEGAAELYDHALHALEELDDELPDRDDQRAELLVARCEALLAAGDVASAVSAVSQLQAATHDSARLSAWATCFEGQLMMQIHPERLDDLEVALNRAAEQLAELDDGAGEAKAHTVRAACLARLGRIGDCETALDRALSVARRAREHRMVNNVLVGAPLAALWGPNPVPRAGGRCLDVVRLLRITTDSPAVEAISTRCQAVLEAYRGRPGAARRMIDSARRTVTELGLRHAALEVEHFAGIIELILDDPAAAELRLRLAYKGFRRIGLDADTAETAALLGRACLALDRDAEADELCTESEHRAGHALKASIAWRVLRAQLLSRSNDHAEARRVAEAAVALAERTDALVDHGDACLAPVSMLNAAGDAAGARSAAQRAADLYGRKGAAALAEKARHILGGAVGTTTPVLPELPSIKLDTSCVRAGERVLATADRGAWDQFEQLFAATATVESRRKIVGFAPVDVPSDWVHQNRLNLETGGMRVTATVIATRGERLALSRLRVGTADVSAGAPEDEFLQVFGIDDAGRIALQIWFDLDDMDAALTELDSLHAEFGAQHARTSLENKATRADDQLIKLLGDDRIEETGTLFIDDVRIDDRRQSARSENNDRTTAVDYVRAAMGALTTKSTLAVRGDLLCLNRLRFEDRAARPSTFGVEALEVTQVDTRGLLVAKAVFDPDDFDAALAELDARFLAGEASPHAHTWSVVLRNYAAANSQELHLTSNCVNIDHRRARAFAPGEVVAYMHATWDVAPDVRGYVETVHRLNDLGAVITHVVHGTSRTGFHAEWREVILLMFDGEQVDRAELFDEADLGAALAQFDALTRPTPKLENTASRLHDKFNAHLLARDWDSMAEMIAEDVWNDDRRKVVSSGIQRGRDTQLASLRAAIAVGVEVIESVVIATRGEYLALLRVRVSGGDVPNAFALEMLSVVEIDSAGLIAGGVLFDVDDFDAAVAELDARYRAGEAAQYAHTWSIIADAYATLNRHELPATTVMGIDTDHRPVVTIEAGGLGASLHAIWNITSQATIYIEAIHELSSLGAVVTHVARGTSQQGFDAEWRDVCLLTIDGDRLSRIELFDEADLGAALAQFDQLTRPTPKLENAATRTYERIKDCYTSGNWAALAEMLAENVSNDDRRLVVNAGVQCGRDAVISEMSGIAGVGVTNWTSHTVAVRGDRMVLNRARASSGEVPEAFHADVLDVVETDADGQVVARVVFDPDDVDAAYAELDARYLAGEAAPFARTWSAIMAAYAAFNRHELAATTPGWVNIDNRRGAGFQPGDMISYIQAAWEDSPDTKIHIVAVHRLSALGGVVTHVAQGISQGGFHAEWRDIHILMVDGDMISHSELFDEADLDTALRRFDELQPATGHLHNTASDMYARFHECFADSDLAAIAAMLAEDFYGDDRRHLVGSGIRLGREAAIQDARAIIDLGVSITATTVIATRGDRLVLRRSQYADQRAAAFGVYVLEVVGLDRDERIAAVITFDPDDLDAAYAELDARYLAGEAAPFARTWSAIMAGYAAIAFAPGEQTSYIQATWDVTPRAEAHVEAVHRLNEYGALVTQAVHGTSPEGFDAEWREIALLTLAGDLINRCELFDEADLDAALARFDELGHEASPR